MAGHTVTKVNTPPTRETPMESTSPRQHDGHQVHPHSHTAQDPKRTPWCTGRFYCETCRDWFSGTACVK